MAASTPVEIPFTTNDDQPAPMSPDQLAVIARAHRRVRARAAGEEKGDHVIAATPRDTRGGIGGAGAGAGLHENAFSSSWHWPVGIGLGGGRHGDRMGCVQRQSRWP